MSRCRAVARRIRTRFYFVGRGLTRGAALSKAHAADRRAGYGDHRGFTYNPKTGMAALT